MRVLDPSTGTASNFATDVVQPVDLQVGNDGALYYLDRLAGSVRRITFASTNTAPAITSHPSSITVAVGQPASFSVSAEGTQPLTFQWQRDEREHPRGDGGYVYVAVGGTLGQRRNIPGSREERDRHGDQQRRHADRDPEQRSHGQDHGVRGHAYSAGDTIHYSGTGTDPRRRDAPAQRAYLAR